MAEPGTLFKIEPSYDSTIAIEVSKTGWLRRRKHVLVFEKFHGQLHYSPEDPAGAKVEITIDPSSLTCRDKWLKARKAAKVAEFARSKVLAAERYPEIRFASCSVTPKPLRGYVVEGKLSLCGADSIIRANVMLGPRNNGRFQIDADAPLVLSRFGIKPPQSLLGLIGTKDEAMVHLLVWATQAH